MEKPTQKFSLTKRAQSFKFAFDGFRALLKHEHNARVHLFFTAFALIAGLLLEISTIEWALIVFCIGLVFLAEILNTCIEKICDFICPEQNPKIKNIKDMAALAVLVSAITAVGIGLVIFLPKILTLVRF